MDCITTIALYHSFEHEVLQTLKDKVHYLKGICLKTIDIVHWQDAAISFALIFFKSQII